MELTFAPRDILQINDARIIFRNFRGEASKYNNEGNRNFALVIPSRDLTGYEVDTFLKAYRDSEMVDGEDGPVLTYEGNEIITIEDALAALGWNVKIKPPRDEDDDPFMYLPVKVKFNDRGPTIYLETGSAHNKLKEETVGCLDKIDIISVDMDIRPYDWVIQEGTPNEKSGRTAYLQSMRVVQEIDRFAEQYAEEEYPEE